MFFFFFWWGVEGFKGKILPVGMSMISEQSNQKAED